jgi:hypothetical protein
MAVFFTRMNLKMNPMKTTIYILTAFFVMNFTLLSAGNPKVIIVKANVNEKSADIAFRNAELAPVTPKEAFFNDAEPRPVAEINHLAPLTPKEATFEDIKTESQIESINPPLLQKLAPQAPREAEFEDSSPEKMTGKQSCISGL